MIRATTGRIGSGVKKQDEPTIRPSSANAKLQSHSYTNLTDDNRPATAAVSRTTSVIPLAVSSDNVVKKTAKPLLDRRLTLCTVDGIGENAKALTRLNTPASSKAKIKIEERITLKQLHRIKTAFEEADTDGSGTLDIDEFKIVVKNCLGVRGRNEEQIVALFMKIDSSSDGEIDWDEFCTYMQLEYAEKEEALLRTKRIHFVLPALSSSTPHHKAPILRVLCIADSSYMCAGQDGLFSFWSTELKLRQTKSILDSSLADRSFTAHPSVWVTDVAMLPAHGKLLVGTGERELHFYELLTFEFYCQVIGLDAIPLRIDVCPIEDDQCLIVYGDDQGCVSIMMFNSIGETLRNWKKVPKVGGVPTVTMQDVANGVGTSFVKWKVHEDWVTELRYFHELRSVISSSNDAATALVRGCTTASTVLDQLHPAINPTTPSQSPSHMGHSSRNPRKNVSMGAQRRQKTDQSVFYVYKGVKTFDFCTTTNILATGGMDRILRLWNPYVPHKPTGLLRGHSSPIVFTSIAGQDGRVFSISADKCIKVWDLVDQNCLVSLNPKLHKVSGEVVACLYTKPCQTIAIATDQLALIKIAQKDNGAMPLPMAMRVRQVQQAGEMPITHTEAVTCCAYNSSFGHVITCSDSSVVKLWDFETGTFMFEFNKAHGTSAITSLTFDSSGRRLITSGRDGAVRIWNYNNGHCLRSLERENDDREISDIVYVEINKNRFIVAVGWDHRINIFADNTDDFHLVQRPYPHWPDDLRSGHTEDIVAVAFGKPNMLATVSYEGLIIVWNIVSGHSVSKLPFPHESLNLTPRSEEDDDLTENKMLHRAVNKLKFLSNRLGVKDSAALVAGCSDGMVIFWNIHTRVAHARFNVMKKKAGISAMVTSSDGNILYIGNHLGYISAWDVNGYAVQPLVDLSDDITCPEETPPPLRLAAWRSHVQPITCLELIATHNIILSSSVDCSVRVWTTRGRYIGSFGQSTPWDIHDPSSWQHPMVPPEVLLDPQSMPEHPVISQRRTVMEVVHASSLEPSDSEEEEEMRDDVTSGSIKSGIAGKRPPPPPKVQRSRSIRSSGSWGASHDAWKRRLSRRLSRSALMTNINYYKDEESAMFDEVKESMCRSAGKRLRHEKLMAQQRLLRASRDASAHAFQSLQYFELGEPPQDMNKPDPRSHIDDVFLIQEEEEVDV